MDGHKVEEQITCNKIVYVARINCIASDFLSTMWPSIKNQPDLSAIIQ